MIADPNKKSLIIVESPTKAKTISKYLPKTCTVVASKGHIVDLNPNPDANDGIYGVYVNNGFKLDYVVVEGKNELISEMRKLLKDKEQLILASDEDREGESIAWHLKEELKPTIPCYRMVFHEITKSAILNAFSNCRDIDMNLVHAQEARRAIDRLQGYGISPILSKKLGPKFSAGRVQSPALKMIVEREKLRRDFFQSEYFSIESVGSFDSSNFKMTLSSVDGRKVADSNSYNKETGELKSNIIVLDSKQADSILSDLSDAVATVDSVVLKNKVEQPMIPFTTSTLQQDATRKLSKSAREIMSIAQRLYENGFITYMRTDSPNLSSECINASRKQIEAIFGSSYLSSSPRNYKAKTAGAQEAHEAIRPAGDSFRRPEETGLSGDELRLYALIWRRTLATQMKECLKSTTTVELSSGKYAFTSSGTTILEKGFRKVYEVSKDDDDDTNEEGVLPSLTAGSKVDIVSSEAKSHMTQPPARFNEATLVKTLESEEIGRPSTYATIISTLIDRHYIVRQGQSLVPTFSGFFVDAFLEKAFEKYIDYDFTKKMEGGLDEIASGSLDKVKYLDEFWFGDEKIGGLAKDLSEIRATSLAAEVKNLILSKLEYHFVEDGHEIAYEIKIGKYGPYISSDCIDEETGKKKMASIDEKKYFPGTFMDLDAKEILFPPTNGMILFGKYELKEGKFGTYLVRLEDGKSISWPDKKTQPEKADEKYLDLLFSLPKTIGQDDDGNEVSLRLGPYGFYASYKDKNIRVLNPTAIDAKAIIASANGDSLKHFDDYEGKSIEIVSGKYGPYIKWGDTNVMIPPQDKKNIENLSGERVIELIKAKCDNKAIDAKVINSAKGEKVQLVNGRYGLYLKWNDKNIALSSEEKKDPDKITPEHIDELIEQAKEKGDKPKRRSYRRASK